MGDKLSPLERARIFLDALKAGKNYDEDVIEGLTVEGASVGRIVCRLRVTSRHANRYGTMHGGCIATLVDVIGSVAIITQTDRSGVSLSINTNYLTPMPIGEVVEIESTVIKIGKQIGTAVVNLTNVATGTLVAQGTHVKALVAHSDMSPLWALALERRQQQGQQPAPASRSKL